MRRVVPIILITVSLAAGIYAGYLRGSHRPVSIEESLQVAFLDAELGSGIVVRTPEGRFAVIDPGPMRTSDSLIDYLRHVGAKRVDLIITNPRPDRAGAAGKLVDDVLVGAVFRGEMGQAGSHPKERVLAARDSVELSETVRMEVLSPPRGLLKGVPAGSDNNSLVLRLRFGETSVLLTSEIRTRGERNVIKSVSTPRSDVLEIARRGESDSTSLELLSVVRPSCCIIGSDGGSREPGASLLSRISTENTGARVFRTDANGTIMVVSDGANVSVETERRSDD